MTTPRIQTSITAAHEKRLIAWLCARLPLWLTPDKLTIIGFVGSLMSFAGYILSGENPLWLWLAISGYFFNWFGDSLDGSIARYRKVERPKYGYFLDHSLDSFSTMILVVSIGASPYVTMTIAMFVLIGYLLLSIHTFLAAKVTDEFKLTYATLGPTEMRLMLIVMTLMMLWFGPGKVFGTQFSGFDIFTFGLAVAMMVIYIVQTTQLTVKLRKVGK
jgi:archaetidylinositol phosphate synthase